MKSIQRDCSLLFMNRLFVRVGHSGFVLSVMLMVFLPVMDSQAQSRSVYCSNLRARIASLAHASGGANARYGAAAVRQKREIDRTQAYANSLHCGQPQFLIFGDAGAPQCGQVMAQISRMRDNLAQLQRVAGGAADSSEINALNAHYEAECRAAPVQEQRANLYNQPDDANEDGRESSDPAELSAPQEEEESGAPARGGAQAVCVRKCDGGYFPLSYSARGRRSDILADLCRASCPNTEAAVYTMGVGADIKTAVSLDGDPYSELPAALKFQKTFDPSCTCKPAGQSWAEALAEAEKILGRGGSGDILVTQKKSDELARPRIPEANTGSKSSKAQIGPTDGERNSLSKPDDDVKNNSTDGATAGKEGFVREVVGPDGIKRHIRVIADPVALH